ncbi:hypothetical protein ACFPU1_12815 [Thalassorhabdus alkalitolerans]|uniref:Uncharacterized protein n=2 Tax=Thalassorhabdus alkalitolerans TaxID=2282697 RepID=A0ABW0YQE9_9BACI
MKDKRDEIKVVKIECTYDEKAYKELTDFCIYLAKSRMLDRDNSNEDKGTIC